MLLHSPECQKTREESLKQVRAWDEKYPNACKSCGAVGVLTTPYSYWEPQETYFCSACLELNICPLCGAKDVWSEEDLDSLDLTHECGFSTADGATKIVRPDFDDCTCTWIDG